MVALILEVMRTHKAFYNLQFYKPIFKNRTQSPHPIFYENVGKSVLVQRH